MGTDCDAFKTLFTESAPRSPTLDSNHSSVTGVMRVRGFAGHKIPVSFRDKGKSMKTRCPHCGSLTGLEISYPAWFKFTDTDGALDMTTLTSVDSEATPNVYCSACNESFGYTKTLVEEFGIENVHVAPLEEWVDAHAAELRDAIRCHVENMTTAEGEDLDDVVRCIMTSVREKLEAKL